MCLHIHISNCFGNILLMNKYSWRSIEQRSDTVLFGYNQMTRTMNTPIHVKVATNRQNVCTICIAYPNFQQIFSLFYLICNFKTKSGISPQMLTNCPTIQEYLSSRVHSFKIKKKTFAFHRLRHH